MTIDLKVASDEKLLPTSEHPFDHFMVISLVERANPSIKKGLMKVIDK